MASGKTSFGRAVAEKLEMEFVDLDSFLESRYGRIPDIFEEHGEDFFRDMESRCLKELLACGRSMILALGGGTVLRETNRKMLKESAKVIWLDTSFEIILSELGNARRPLAEGKPISRLEELYNSRRTLYKETADATVVIDSFDFSIAIGNLAQAVLSFESPTT